MRGEALKGHLDLLLLTVVGDGPAHGYAIVERVAHLSHGIFELGEGTVYPALHRLERRGLIRGRWTREAPRPRRIYELTDRGRLALSEQRQEWNRFVQGVTGVLAEAS